MPTNSAKSKRPVPLRRVCMTDGAQWPGHNRPELAVKYMQQKLYVLDLKGSQPWLTFGITCEALKSKPMLGSHCTSIKSDLQTWGLVIKEVQKFLRRPSRSFENHCLSSQQPQIISTVTLTVLLMRKLRHKEAK